jgi:hypothetical protein
VSASLLKEQPDAEVRNVPELAELGITRDHIALSLIVEGTAMTKVFV